MSKHENEYMNAKQVATSELSAIAMLDRATEARLYYLYRAFFQIAEETRGWNVWNDIPWDQVVSEPSPDLVTSVVDAYREDLLLPDYSAKALHILRSSRGRAWFITRWSYEEGKHLLALHEWLLRSGVYTDEQLRQFAEDLLNAYTWEPPFSDPLAVFADAYLWERTEVERAKKLLRMAEERGDVALTAVLTRTLTDEKAHADFLRDALRIIAEAYPDDVADAVRRVSVANEFPGGALPILTDLNLSASL